MSYTVVLLLCTFDTCVQQPVRLPVYITHTAVACLSVVIASLFMVACRQQCLISGLNGAACDSGNKCLCSVSLIWPFLRNGQAPERGRIAELGLRVATAAKRSVPLWHLRPAVISQPGPGSRAIYSQWWKGLGRGSIGARQVQREEGVRSLGNRNQRWGQMTASPASGGRCSLSPLEAPEHSKSLALRCIRVNVCALMYAFLCVFQQSVCVCACMRWLLACDTGVERSGGHVFSCSNHLSYFIWLTLAQRNWEHFLFKHPCVLSYYTTLHEQLWSFSCNGGG